MRLQENERQIILSTISNYVQGARVYLFGSRSDDTRKGGDIDLLLIGNNITRNTIRRLKIELKEKLGDQKIDVLSEEPEHRTNFGKLIELDAIPL
jgi:predicted nucleotidyltransferase